MSISVFAPRRPIASLAGDSANTTTERKTPLDRGREATALLLFAGALYSALALASFQGDPANPELHGGDWVGPVGASLAHTAVGLLGIVAWGLPIELALFAAPLLRRRPSIASVARGAGDVLVACILSALLHIGFTQTMVFGSMPVGGSFGELFGEVLRSLFSTIGSYIIGMTTIGLILIGRASFSFIACVERAERGTGAAAKKVGEGAKAVADAWTQAREMERDRFDRTARRGPAIDTHGGDDAIIAALSDEDAGEAQLGEVTSVPVRVADTDFAAPRVPAIVMGVGNGGSQSASPRGSHEASSSITLPSSSETAGEGAAMAPPNGRGRGRGRRAADAGSRSDTLSNEPSRDDKGTDTGPSSGVRNGSDKRAAPKTAKATIVTRTDVDAPAGVGAADSEDDSSGDVMDERAANAGARARTTAAATDAATPEADAAEVEPPEAAAPVTGAAVVDGVRPIRRRGKADGPTIVDTTDQMAAQKAEPKPAPAAPPPTPTTFKLPSTELLEPPPATTMQVDREALHRTAKLLEKTLNDYGVTGMVEEIHPGPTVTTFEVAPQAGTKVSKVASLADDLALGLSRKVRIIAPIPGKNRIGFEIPNEARVPVSLRDLIEDQRFTGLNVPLPVVLGRDHVGAPYFADLASMPHAIVAGATGAGKSVGLNVMLTSLLYRRTPEELRMLMVDPKVVELAPFDRIPHMLLPVVTDMKQAANALKWAVDEMERRYQLFANAGTKNISTYNAWVDKVRKGLVKAPAPKQVAAITADGESVSVSAATDGTDGGSLPDRIPYIVIVVDEFSDLMMQQGKDVEAAVARLAQKARAAGMHVILATQRPSVDVITGIIKANFPTRIAYRVSQKVDSRTILDEQGAEHLLGRGDMLVKMNGTNDTRRVQCPFVSEEEVQRITDFLRTQGAPVYDENILKPREDEDGGDSHEDTEQDPLYDSAVQIVADTRRCSTSWLQRKLNLGYNRAARIVEMMEKRGMVGPPNGSKEREVLISSI